MILVTGASGFVGRRLAAEARAHFPDENLFCYAARDSCAYERAGKAFLAEQNIAFTEADFVGGAGLVKIREEPRVVFHLAANSATYTSDHRSNDLGTRNLIHSLAGLGRKSHVIFTSSVAVTDSRMDYGEPLTEATSAATLPLTKYGASKLRAEQWLQNEARRMGFALTILRPVTIYGPGARPNTLFPVLKQMILRNSSLARLTWPGLTGLVHVDDVVRVALSLAATPPASGMSELYFVQSEAHSLAEVSRMAHGSLRLPYRGIGLPAWFWKCLGRSLYLLLRAPGKLSGKIHGSLWRLRLLTENVFWCDPRKLRNAIPKWVPLCLKDNIGSALA
jgi:nucleoside-diphosphate-sugar epimerase